MTNTHSMIETDNRRNDIITSNMKKSVYKIYTIRYLDSVGGGYNYEN